jgi:hypothetical protein
MRYAGIIAFTGMLLAIPCLAAAPDLPDHARTKGASDPTITASTYREILCKGADGKKHHTTDEKRPNSSYTTALKKKQLGDWDYPDKKTRDYEEDHLISLELGGDDSAEANLWPQPYAGKWGARTKDTLELELGRRICLRESDDDYLSLKAARDAASGDWIASYKQYVCGRKPKLSAKMVAQCEAR